MTAQEYVVLSLVSDGFDDAARLYRVVEEKVVVRRVLVGDGLNSNHGMMVIFCDNF